MPNSELMATVFQPCFALLSGPCAAALQKATQHLCALRFCASCHAGPGKSVRNKTNSVWAFGAVKVAERDHHYVQLQRVDAEAEHAPPHSSLQQRGFP